MMGWVVWSWALWKVSYLTLTLITLKHLHDPNKWALASEQGSRDLLSTTRSVWGVSRCFWSTMKCPRVPHFVLPLCYAVTWIMLPTCWPPANSESCNKQNYLRQMTPKEGGGQIRKWPRTNPLPNSRNLENFPLVHFIRPIALTIGRKRLPLTIYK